MSRKSSAPSGSIFDAVAVGAAGLSILSLIRSEEAINSSAGGGGSPAILTEGAYINYDQLSGVIAVDHVPASHAIYVDKSGNDSTGDGSILTPLLTIQAAHTRAMTYPSGDNVHIYVGPGSYNEDVTITRVKTSIVGATDAINKTTAISSLTVTITSGVSGIFNDIVSVSSLLIEKSSGTSVVTLGGDQPFTFNAYNSYLYSEGTSTSCLRVTNTSTGGIRLSLFKCIVQNTASNTASMILSNTINGRLEMSTFYAGSGSCLTITTSNITATNTTFQTDSGSNIVNIVSSRGTPFNPITAPLGSIAFTVGNCTFVSTAINGSGIVLAANSTSTVVQSVFAIPPGSGSSVAGTASCYFINGNNLVYPGTNSTVAAAVTRLNMTAL